MGLFDYVKDNVFRRGTDDPLFRKGMDKLNDVLGERKRERAASEWPLASDPDGIDIFRPLLTDEWFGLTWGKIVAEDFSPKRVDTFDVCGWHFGYGTQVMGVDVDGPEAAGSDDSRYDRDLWLEVELTPTFNQLEFDTRMRVLLDDMEQRYRRFELPDDYPETQRHVVTGRLRSTGNWCAVAHLVPLVVRIHADRADANRETAYAMMHSLLERIDHQAFVTWRDLVHERNGTRHDPSLPPWKSGRPAEGGPEESADPPVADPGAGTDSGAPVEPVRLPTPDDLKSGLDGGVSREPIPLDHEALATGLGGSADKVRVVSVLDFGEGTRVQAAGGRAIDVLRVTDPAAVRALGQGAVDGVGVYPRDDIDAFRWADLDPDSDHATRGLLTSASGAVFYVRVRGMSQAEAGGPIRTAIDQLKDL